MKLLSSLCALLLAACSAPAWDGQVQVHGSLREVHAGSTEGRVALASIRSPHAVGIGVLADMAGEVLVYGGEVWTARVGDGRVQVERGARPAERAAFLALADVPEWRAFSPLGELTLETLEQALASLLAQTETESREVVPFALEGELASLDAHVVAGACPASGVAGPEPVRRHWERVSARLVGFFSERPPGELTHAGTRTHVHVLVAGAEPFVGHVDAVKISARTRIFVPGKMD
jgi:hypothetical protein